MDKNQEHKFNFSENEKNQDQVNEQSKGDIKKDARGLIANVKKFLTKFIRF